MTRKGGEVVLFVGGARSGKSRMAQTRAESLTGALVYLATGEARDEEMTARIDQHRADRGGRWRTVEVPLALPEAIECEALAGNVVLVDCLTLWLSNLMLGDHDVAVATERLLGALAGARSPVFVISNEVGMGIVPENALARRFRDEAGRMNQRVAAVADEALLVAAGLSVRMK